LDDGAAQIVQVGGWILTGIAPAWIDYIYCPSRLALDLPEKKPPATGCSLSHEAGVTSLDDWFSQYSACDQAYLLDSIEPKRSATFRPSGRKQAPRIVPKPVPALTPERRTFRMDGVVI
jgi:hypothetical protein